MSRSARVSPESIKKVKLALRRNGFVSQQALAINLGISSSTVSNFFNGKAVDYTYFLELCEKLGLVWQEIVDLEEDTNSDNKEQESNLSVAKQETPNRKPRIHQDWGLAPDVSVFYGRQEELAILKQWIVNDRCRLVTMLGMGGIGKTALAIKLAREIQNEFEYIIWHTFLYQPTIDEFLNKLLLFLTHESVVNLPEALEAKVAKLLEILRSQRCLIILDNLDSLLSSYQSSIKHKNKEDFQEYTKLLRFIGELRHQSCILITSRKKFKELDFLETKEGPVRSLILKGVDKEAAKQLLRDGGLIEQQEWGYLIEYYQGHPLALKIVSEIIKELFNGNTAEIIETEAIFIGTIGAIFDQDFQYLSDLQIKIMYQLAITPYLVFFKNLQEIFSEFNASQILEVLDYLKKHSLIEIVIQDNQSCFILQPFVRQYVINRYRRDDD